MYIYMAYIWHMSARVQPLSLILPGKPAPACLISPGPLPQNNFLRPRHHSDLADTADAETAAKTWQI